MVTDVWPRKGGRGAGAAVPPVVLSLQEFPDQQLDSSDIPPHLEDGAILLRVRKVEGVHRLRPHVLLPNDAWRRETRPEPLASPMPSAPFCPLCAYPFPHSKGSPGPLFSVAGAPGPWGQVLQLSVAQDEAPPLWGREEAATLSPRGTRPLTCADARLAEQQRQAPHPVEGVEVVDALVQAVHPVLVLRRPRVRRAGAPAPPSSPRPLGPRLGPQVASTQGDCLPSHSPPDRPTVPPVGREREIQQTGRECADSRGARVLLAAYLYAIESKHLCSPRLTVASGATAKGGSHPSGPGQMMGEQNVLCLDDGLSRSLEKERSTDTRRSGANLGDVTPREISQSQKDRCCALLLA